MLLVLHDVTELKKLEKVRRDFVANVSHELRTPVTVDQGLRRDAAGRRHARPGGVAAVPAKSWPSRPTGSTPLFEDLLTLSRIEQEAERAEIALAPGPIRPVLEAAVEACRFKAAEKNIRMEVTCPDGPRRRPSTRRCWSRP